MLAGCTGSSEPGETEKPQAPHFPDIDGLVVFYEFDGNLNNEVADDYHATCESEVTYVGNRLGAPSSAVHVTSEVIRVVDHPDLDITGAITLAAWVKPEFSNHAYNAVIDKNYDEAYSLGMGGATAPDTVAIRGYITDTGFWQSDAIPYGTDTWTRIAFTFDESTVQADFYIDGEHVGGGNADIEIGTCDKDLRIGVAYYGDRFQGGIDQVAIFDRALSPAEIAELCAFE